MAIKTSKRLTKAELEKLKHSMRQWQTYQVHEVAKLYLHINALEDEIRQRESRVYELEQADFFRKNKDFREMGHTPPKAVPEGARKYSLVERLKLMVDSGVVGGEEWLQTLKWNRITEEQALEMIKNPPHIADSTIQSQT